MTGKTILAIDTDTETTQQIVSILEAEDYLVFTAPNKDIGLAMAKKVNPSLIFINPSLSGASGLEVCKTIHGTEQLKDIPIVVLSSFEGTMDQRYAEVYGIVDSLKNPSPPKNSSQKQGMFYQWNMAISKQMLFRIFRQARQKKQLNLARLKKLL